MKILNISLNGVRDYYQTYFEIIRPFASMTHKEAMVFATILELRHLSNVDSLDYRQWMDGNAIDYLLKANDISAANYRVILYSLKKKGFIVDYIINKVYDIRYETDGGIIFSLKQK